jgi:sugar phosphate isomerase/epimerase
MKLGFWTGGMPNWSHAERAKRASELGYDGVAIGRGSLGPDGLNTSNEKLDEIKQTYAQAGIEVDMLLNSSSQGGFGGPVTIDSDEYNWGGFTSDLAALAKAAARLGIPRIMATVVQPMPGVKWNWPQFIDNLGEASLEAIQDLPRVNVVYENHNGSTSATQLLEMTDKLGNGRLGVALSPDHCVVMQEDAVKLADRYPSGIQHVCFGDRRPVEEDLGKFDGRYYYVRYEACVIGEGITPVKEIMTTLNRHGYNGYASLKWEKSDEHRPPLHPNGYGWHLPTGEAVLPGYVEFMKSLGIAGSK